MPRPEAGTRLFCFPYAGGGASIFRAWPAAMAPDIEVWLVHLPGRERRIAEPAPASMLSLCADALGGLRPYLRRPFAFFGHSMGALLSFELTRLVRAAALPGPVCLIASGLGAPHLPDTRAPIHALPLGDFKRRLVELNGTPRDVIENNELMELVLPLLRADFKAVETYTYVEQPALSLPLRIYGGREDDEIAAVALAAWRHQSDADTAVRLFDGDHFYLNSNRDTLLRQIADDLRALNLSQSKLKSDNP